MKKLKYMFATAVAVLSISTNAFANIGDIGFSGGISQGRKLQTNTERVMGVENKETVFEYKEMIFIGGTPEEFVGTIKVSNRAPAVYNDSGSYKETVDISPSVATTPEVTMNRRQSFTVNYRKNGNQIIKNYDLTSWSESVTTSAGTFTLDNTLSDFNVSIIEDLTASVTYYKGNSSGKAVYTNGGEDTILNTVGDIYGYTSPWSTTETHRINGTVLNDDWQMQYQVRPSVTVNKLLQFGQNEPNAISFDGNYREVTENKSGLRYDIFVKPAEFYYTPNSGGTTITSYNTFEQLIAPDMNFLKGHFAEYDIKKLFALEILDGDPKFYLPNQSITRSQYVTMLVKAAGLSTDKYSNPKNKQIRIVFPDVNSDREDYKYIMAAYDAGIAVGRDNGYYYPDSSLTREEAIVILLRTIGLENLGLDTTPMTVFVDDANISSWAKKEIYAAQRIGLISGDDTGRINPKAFVSKAEAAALVNRLIDYERYEMQVDYADNIINYTN